MRRVSIPISRISRKIEFRKKSGFLPLFFYLGPGVKELTGIVSDITFRNEDNGFTVMRVDAEGQDGDVTCVGIVPTVEGGTSVRLQGEWILHAKFGRQFDIKSFDIVRPTTRKAIHKFLCSGLIDNIGDSRARKIVDHFGERTLEVLDEHPEELCQIPGIGRKISERITHAWQKQRAVRYLVIFLQEFGVSVNLAAKIHKAYGARAQEVISTNPYALIDDIRGVGFKRADAIAQKLDYQHDSYKRIRAGLVFTCQEAVGAGHCYLPSAELIRLAAELLEVSHAQVEAVLADVVATGDLVDENGCIYGKPAYIAESSVAEQIRNRLTVAAASRETLTHDIAKWLSAYSIRHGWKGDPRQLEAITAALHNAAFLLTGGPGTGKTTILRVIVAYLREKNVSVTLAAPTGRAAQRMGTLSGLEAQTIHRLLEFKPGGNGFEFQRNQKNPLDADTVIIDEVSMIDLFLMRSLLLALKRDTRLILVGDNNQLPSVGAGNVLTDLISSGVFPHVNLTTVFRQAAQSRIVTSAHEIISGQLPQYRNDLHDNCFFMTEQDPQRCLQTIVNLVENRLPGRYGFDAISDIQVLAPMHRGILGTISINQVLREVLNPHGAKLARGETVYRTGDKVMQIRNNYDLGVFNGDIGYVVDIIDSTMLTIEFPGQVVHYGSRELDDIVHAYCISIHKSQGCEFRAVVIPVMPQHYIMLQRNLIYTALTRAREFCVFIGSPRALSMAVFNNQAVNRYSRLSQKLVTSPQQRD
ncbi:MAG: ATP-dependent RecD-like DNA helicase [Chitinivibrionales bacterium]|nr:ATP-dependent RecD-like DNA helicase [Chitinivibrionales bacterium]